jgi:hypothetical protein
MVFGILQVLVEGWRDAGMMMELGLTFERGVVKVGRLVTGFRLI